MQSNILITITPANMSAYQADEQLKLLIDFLELLFDHEENRDFDYGIPEIMLYSNFGENSA